MNQGVQLAVLGYGRDNEFESDLYGAKYAADADYDTKEFDDFFYTLKRQEKTRNSWLQTLYSSHPPTTERIDRLNQYIASENLSTTSTASKSNQDYLKKISGLYMGPGNMIGNLVTANNQTLYENLAYQIQFVMQPGWQISKSDEPDALVVLTHNRMPIYGSLELLRPSKKITSISQLALPFLRSPNKKMSHKRLSYLKVPAYQTKYKMSFSKFGEAVETATYFLNNGFAYRLVFVSKKTFSTTYDREVESFLRTVSFVPTQRLRQTNAYWVLTHTVLKPQSLQSIRQQYDAYLPMPLTELSYLNNTSSSKQFKKGTLMKMPVLYPYL